MNLDKNILSLRDFWSLFAKQAPAISRLPLPTMPSLIYGLNGYFGNLTIHSSTEKSATKLEITCTKCTNCTAKLKDYVCETHCGIISGTIEYLLGEKVSVRYQPDNDIGDCIITVIKGLHQN